MALDPSGGQSPRRPPDIETMIRDAAAGDQRAGAELTALAWRVARLLFPDNVAATEWDIIANEAVQSIIQWVNGPNATPIHAPMSFVRTSVYNKGRRHLGKEAAERGQGGEENEELLRNEATPWRELQQDLLEYIFDCLPQPLGERNRMRRQQERDRILALWDEFRNPRNDDDGPNPAVEELYAWLQRLEKTHGARIRAILEQVRRGDYQ